MLAALTSAISPTAIAGAGRARARAGAASPPAGRRPAPPRAPGSARRARPSAAPAAPAAARSPRAPSAGPARTTRRRRAADRRRPGWSAGCLGHDRERRARRPSGSLWRPAASLRASLKGDGHRESRSPALHRHRRAVVLGPNACPNWPAPRHGLREFREAIARGRPPQPPLSGPDPARSQPAAQLRRPSGPAAQVDRRACGPAQATQPATAQAPPSSCRRSRGGPQPRRAGRRPSVDPAEPIRSGDAPDRRPL